MTETQQQRDERMTWWREARFGLFIHWGLYSLPAGVWKGEEVASRIPGWISLGEWGMFHAEIPVGEYAKLAAEFNPTKFDADAIAQLAKDAGMRYVVITCKHHDGFAMFDSEVSPFNICDATPFKRDPVAELAEACQKHGLKFGVYYSHAQDWSHPGGATWSGYDYWDKAQNGDMDEYLRTIAAPQVRELLTKYGPVSIMWWDTPVGMTKERADIFRPLMDLQPGIIVNNRLGHYEGDVITPEQEIPATGLDSDWETCMTINDTWGYKSGDHNWKSTTTLVRNLIDIASKGGNFLVNVGPDALGEVPQPSVERLREIGQWMDVNGEAIHGTSSSPFSDPGFDGRCTVKGNKLYLFVFAWPEDGVNLVETRTQPTAVRFLNGSLADYKVTPSDHGRFALAIRSPIHPDPIATVVEVTYYERPGV